MCIKQLSGVLTIILIFSTIHKLNLLLELFVVEDRLIIFHFIWILKVPKIFKQGGLVKSQIREGMFVVVQFLLPIPHGNACINSLSLHHYYIPWGKCMLGIQHSPSLLRNQSTLSKYLSFFSSYLIYIYIYIYIY